MKNLRVYIKLNLPTENTTHIDVVFIEIPRGKFKEAYSRDIFYFIRSYNNIHLMKVLYINHVTINYYIKHRNKHHYQMYYALNYFSL